MLLLWSCIHTINVHVHEKCKFIELLLLELLLIELLKGVSGKETREKEREGAKRFSCCLIVIYAAKKVVIAFPQMKITRKSFLIRCKVNENV